MEPLISVIVPVYNVEAYLDACLESVTCQSYRGLEIIVVDDGSTDGSGAVCDRWAERDERIRVIHQPNAGLSAARNTGLDAMHGELVMMVDSDDVLHPEATSILLDTMRSHQADIAVGGYTPFWGTEPEWSENPSPRSTVYSQSDALLAIFYQDELTHSAWGRLYRSSLFNDIRYPVGRYYEDLAIIYPLLMKCATVVKVDRSLYGYRQREQSILADFSSKRADVLTILEDLERQMEQEAPQYLKAVRSRLLSAYFNILILSRQDRTHNHKALQDHCWQGIKRLRNASLKDGRVRSKNKWGIVASWCGRWVVSDLLGRHYTPRP